MLQHLKLERENLSPRGSCRVTEKDKSFGVKGTRSHVLVMSCDPCDCGHVMGKGRGEWEVVEESGWKGFPVGLWGLSPMRASY